MHLTNSNTEYFTKEEIIIICNVQYMDLAISSTTLHGAEMMRSSEPGARVEVFLKVTP
jgi:hypothetical protein